MDYGSSIESEKAKAMAMSRYRRIQRFARIWWLVEVFVALTLLISFPLIRLPISTDSFSNFSFRRFTGYFLNPHINFIVGNAIIAVLFLLSRRNGAGREVSSDGYLDFHEETVSIVEIETEFPPYCPAAPVAEEKVSDVGSEDVEAKLNCEEAAVSNAIEEAAVSNAIEEATKQIRRFERTQSEKLKRELGTKQREKFRRSESEIVVRRSGGGEVESVDNLSSDEFRRKIETFIENEKHQRSFRAQKKMMAGEIS